MNQPTKVTMECTADGYAVSVFAGDRCIAKRSSTMKSVGEAQDDQKADWYETLPEFEELAEELDGLTFGPFGISCELRKLREF
jgi:hypothetical protein